MWRLELPIGRLAAQVAAICLLAAVLGALANVVRPKGRIAWVEDWSKYVEAKATEAGITVIFMPDVRRHLEAKNALIFDARPAIDFAAGHIPGARPLPFEEVATRLVDYMEFLEPAAPVVTYCAGPSCDEALLLSIHLRSLGFTNVLFYAAGLEQWAAAKNPVAKEGPP